LESGIPDVSHEVAESRINPENAEKGRPPFPFWPRMIMTSIRHSGNYSAVIDQKDKTIKVRSRISSWNVAYEIEADLESLDQAIDKMELDDLIEQGYQLTRE